MKRLTLGVIFVAAALGMMPATDPANANSLVVQMTAPQSNGDPFPIGWASINVPRGEVTMLAILPRNTVVPASGENDPNAGRWVFEGWLADLAPPHRCPEPDPGDATDEVDTSDDAFAAADPSVLDETNEVPICGSRLSSETHFRGFPGIPNKTFAKTYFPVSQGLLRQVGPPIGDWALYTLTHKINMGLRPYDVVGVTVEPPRTGAPRADYDPRPNPVVALIGRIPHPNLDGTANDDSEDGEDNTTNPPRNRRPISGTISVR